MAANSRRGTVTGEQWHARGGTMDTSEATRSSGPPPSKTAYVLERLREDIRSGAINPGQPLRQTDLAQRYGVSPTPVREALRLLEADGAISYSPHKGATVAELSPGNVKDLYLLRAEVEGLATRLAVQRLPEGAGDEIAATHRRLCETGSAGLDRARLNRELHFAIYRHGSPLVTEFVTTLWRPIPPQVTMWQDDDIATVFNAQHDKIVRAVLARDADGAARCMADHIMTAGRYRSDWDAGA